MTRLTLQTSSRLHFGLLSWGSQASRRFGGVGLMIDAPGLTMTAEPAEAWEATGPLSARVLGFVQSIVERMAGRGLTPPLALFRVIEAPPEHVGLGVGTQLGLSIARLIFEMAGQDPPTTEELASVSGRGLRSGIGLHGFAQGGLIVDGGRARPEGIPALLTRIEFPRDWSVLVVIPKVEPGLHGPEEIQAFAKLPDSPQWLTDRLCRLVLLGLLPAVVERDLTRFGEALEEIQHQVGQGFAPTQGGVFARPELKKLVDDLRSQGLQGVGQSSWGPTIYGFSNQSAKFQESVVDRLRNQFGLGDGEAFWTSAAVRGYTIHRDP